jgi:hypothetical protein
MIVAYPAVPGAASGPDLVATTSPGLTRRPNRADRTGAIALLLAAFVATGGVAFAVGRWSTGQETGGQGPGSFPQLAALPAAGQGAPQVASGIGAADLGAAADDAAGAATGTSSVAADTVRAAEGRRAPGAGIDAASGAGTDAAQGAPATRGQDAPAADSALLQGSGADPGGVAGGPPGPGGPRGFGVGLEGTIEAIEDGQLTITSSDGTSSTVLVDETTTIARQEALAMDDLRVGDSVRVTPSRGPGPGFGMAPGGDSATAGDADAQQPASQVIVLGEDGA